MKKHKQDIINIITIVVIIIIYVLLTTNFFTYSYGSTTDWDCQHWIIPDFFRKQFYATGQLFTNFAPNIGDGQNIYYLSYYGYLSPIVLLSYLLPFIPMKIYIEGISIVGLIASGILFYLWMRKKYDSKLSVIVSLLFVTTTPLLFHSHRHIMYTCYMPFLILALKEIDNKYLKNKSEKIDCKFIIYLFLIIMSNYFFAVSALFAISLYEFHSIFIYNKETRITKKIRREIINFIIEVAIAILMSSVLLLPTFIVIMLGRSKSNVDINYLGLIIPNYRIEEVFYGSYSSGITLLSLTALIKNIKSRKFNVLSILILIALFLPLISFLLNGTMYIDSKVLIPLIPIIIYITAHFLNKMDDKTVIVENKKILIALITIAVILIILNRFNMLTILFALELVLLILIFRTKDKKRHLLTYAIFISIASLLINTKTDELEVNKSNNYTGQTEIRDIEGKYNYRVTTNKNLLANINNINNIDYNLGSIYSSTSNPYFKNYYYSFGVEVSQRSYGKVVATKNELFNIVNSNKYIFTVNKEDNTQEIKVNEDALTIARSNMEKLSLDEFEKLKFPYSTEALYKYLIVDEKIDNFFESDIEEYDGSIKLVGNEGFVLEDNLNITIKKPTIYKFKLEDLNSDDLLFISFNINEKKCPYSDRSIVINGIKNTISCKDWKYYNKNKSFYYVVNGINAKKEIKVELKAGKYNLKNIKIYRLNYNKVKENINGINKIDLSIDRKNNNKINGTYESLKDDIVYLQIPYDKGFNIKVNDKKVEYFNINNGMIGFNVNKGTNNIEIEFNAPLLKESLILSSIGVISLISIALYHIVRKEKNNEYRKRNKRNKGKK